MDGQVFPLNNPPTQFHVNCRCSIAPEPKDLYPSVAAELETGEQWLSRQPDKTQRAMLPSRAAYDAYKAGDLTLHDFVGTHHSHEWGDTYYQLSGRKALANRDDRQEKNRPTKPMNHMNDRHLLNRVRGSRGASRTTLIPPDMVGTVQADMVAIRNGNGVRHPDNHYEINGRTYAWEKAETYYPVNGPGLIVVDRSTLKAIQTFARHGGINDQALAQLSRDQHMPSESVELAKELWRKRTNRGDDDVLD